MTTENNNETQRPRHTQRKEESASRLLIRNIMNLYFIVAVVVLIVLYFVRPGIQQTTGYLVFAMFTVSVKIAEMVIRFLPK